MKPRAWPLALALFFDMVGFAMIIPDIQFKLEDLRTPPWLFGTVLASMFVVQSVTSPAWGRLSDRVGRKPVFVLTTLVSALSMAVYGLSSTVGVVLLSRCLAGVGAANAATAQAGISDLADEASRTAVLGRLSAAISAGLLIGPVIGGFVSASLGSHVVGFAGAGFSLMGALIAGSLTRLAPPQPRAQEARHGLALLKRRPEILPFALLSATAWFALACLEGTFGRLIHHTLGLGSKEFGIIFGWESAMGLVVSAFFLGWLTKRIREIRLLQLSFAAQGIGLALAPIAPSLAALLGLSTLLAAGQGCANPTLNSLASRAVPADEHGELFGTLQSMRSLGFVLGPVIGAWLFALSPGWPYWVAGGVCAASAILAPRAFAPAERHE